MTTFALADTGLDGEVDYVDFRGAPVAVEDLNLDGLPDVVIGNRSGGLFWYDNLGGLRFEARTNLGDADGLGNISALSAADLDNDGRAELVVVQENLALIFSVSTGGAELVEQLESGATESILPFDVDGDGDLDLLFVNLDHHNPGFSTNRLFLRGPSGSYQRADTPMFSDGWSWAATAVDFDDDGDLDIYVANDTLTEDFGSTQANGRDNPVDRFYRQESTPEGLGFVEVASDLGLDSPRSSMGGIPLELPRGTVGLFVPDVGANKVFELGTGPWPEVAGELGLDSPRRATDRCNGDTLLSDCLLFSWGMAQEDFNLDGRLEVVVTQGGYYLEDIPPPVLWYQEADDGYEELTPSFGCHEGFALVPADFDGDGDLDLLLGPRRGRPIVLANQQDGGEASLSITLEGRTSNREGRGAVIRLRYAERVVRRWVGAGGVSHASRPPRVLVASRGLQSIEIIWPSGIEQAVMRDDSWDLTTSLRITEPEAPR